MNSKKIICHDRHDNKYLVDSDKFIFRPSVYGLLIEGGKILLSKQWEGYDFPGGGVDIRETLEEALKREFFEETGLEIIITTPVYCGTSFFVPIRNKSAIGDQAEITGEFWNCPMAYFLVKKLGGKISKDNLDEEEKYYADLPEWIDLDEIDKIKFYNSIDSVAVIKSAAELSNA